MSRNIGTFNFSANLEGIIKAPIDARQVVGLYSDLTNPATWNASTQVWLYNGAMVAVGSDPTPSKNGIYWLCDAATYTSPSSWIKAGAGSGTLTGATNGLHLTNGGTVVALGGTLTGSTFITDPLGKGIQYSSDYSGTFNNNSLVSKLYVDTIASGLKPKAAVEVATTGPITLSGLTHTIDGFSGLVTGMRVLVKDQASAIANGIYSASTGTWGRTSDFNGIAPYGTVESGSYMWVLTGTTNGSTAWVLTTPDPITVGVTPMNFALFAAVTDVIAGTGITVNMLGGVHVVSLSVPTQAVVNSAITGATNGLTGNSRNIELGGTLCRNTCIDIANKYLNICTQNGTQCTCLCIDSSLVNGSTFSGIGSTSSASIIIQNSGNATLSATCGVSSCGSSVCVNGGNGIKIVDSAPSHCLMYYDHAFGACYCQYMNNKNQIPNIDYVTGLTNNLITASDSQIIFKCIGSYVGSNDLKYCHTLDSLQINAGSNAGGNGSVAMAAGSAYGLNSVALGNGIAVGDYSFATANGNAYGLFSVAIGSNNQVCSDYSVIIGGGSNIICSGNTIPVIIGGSSNIICSGNSNTVLLGGSIITIPADCYTDTVVVPSLSIWNTPSGSGNILSRDASTKLICFTSITESVTGATNGLSKSGKNIVLGGKLTGNTTIVQTGHTFTICTTSAGSTPKLIMNPSGNFAELGMYCSSTCRSKICSSGSGYPTIGMYSTGGTSCSSFVTNTNLCFNSCNGGLGCGATVYLNENGLYYATNYDNRWNNCCYIPDINYVTGCTTNLINCYANIEGVRNIITQNQTLTATDNFVGIDIPTAGIRCVCLYASPRTGQRVTIADVRGDALTYPIYIDGNSKLINGYQCSAINTDYGSITFIFNCGACGGSVSPYWSAIAFVN